MPERTYFEKKGIDTDDIMYITKEGRKSILNLLDGKQVETFKPIKELMSQLPENTFEIINKGIAISRKYVIKVENNEYFMKDGCSFKGRVRKTKNNQQSADGKASGFGKDEWEQFAVLEKFPLAFCIIELVFDEKGRGIDFIFRYCNSQMEQLEGKPISEMINRSFYEVFEGGDKKWLITYADVALNGGEKIIESYSPEIGENLRIYCFQPKPSYCACVLITI